MSTMLPIIDQMQGATDDRVRADLLLRCPDSVLLKYETAFLQACRHFPAGAEFVQQRNRAMRSVRSEAGALPTGLALELEIIRAELTAYAAGAPLSTPA